MATWKVNHLARKLAEREKAPETHLFKTVGFWLAIAPPLLLGSGLALYAGIQEGKIWTLTIDGYNSFLKDFKLPIGIMGLAIPLGALAAAVHRSVQTSRQIIEQNQQNVFSNYLEHRKHFKEFVDDTKPFGNLAPDIPTLYEALFPQAADGSLSPDPKIIDQVLDRIEKISFIADNEYLSRISKKKIDLQSADLFKEIAIIEKLLNTNLGLTLNTRSTLPEKHRKFQRFLLFCESMRETLPGIYQCANFHRRYLDRKAFERAEEILLAMENKLREFLDVFQLSMAINGALADYQYLPSQALQLPDPNKDLNFPERLRDIDNDFQVGSSQIDNLLTVIDHHIPKECIPIIKRHAPTSWQEHLYSDV